MKKITLLLLLSFLVATILIGQNKHALLIGVSEYAENTGWRALHAYNDIALLKKTLQKQDFDKLCIQTLENEKVTKTGIEAAIKQLIARVTKKDIVVLSFSGHGQQVRDFNQDEVDGLDEAFVPYDSPKLFKEKIYEGDKLFTDDELRPLLIALRKKLGKKGQLLVLMDACHSGTSTRGYGITRGTDNIMASPDYIAQLPTTKDSNSLEQSNQRKLAPMVAFFSSGAQQLSYEMEDDYGKFYGLLTYAFCQALNQDKVNNYGDLFTKIKQTIETSAYYQTPEMEGNKNSVIFKDQVISPSSSFNVMNAQNNTLIKLDGGRLNGLDKGAIVGFYKGIKTNKSQPFAKGVVEHASLSDCEVVRPKGFTEHDFKHSKVYVEQASYGQLKIKIALELQNKDLSSLLKADLDTFPFVNFDPINPDIVIVQADANTSIQILTKDNYLLEKINSNLTATESQNKVKEALEAFIRGQFLRELELTNQGFNAQLFLVKNGEILSDNNLSVNVGDSIELMIKNTGDESFYFSILDIPPSNELVTVIPWEKPANQYLLSPSSSYTTKIGIRVTLPAGREVVKFICTPESVDLKDVVDSRGSNTTRGTNHPFQTMLKDLFFKNDVTRSGFPLLIDTEVGMVGSLVFGISN